ncbi:MAG: hypothetical protein KDI79_00375 [Anaerolineae bacterium]|nr:hypothetical protein [Anaerolineae bacterium]
MIEERNVGLASRPSVTPVSKLSASGWLISAIILGSMVLTMLALWPHLSDKYRVPRDLQNFYWMARFQDPTLFPIDYLRADQLVELNILGQTVVLYPLSLGYGLLYYLGSFVIDFIWMSKLLVFLLMPLCVYYLYRLGYKLQGTLSAVSVSCLFIFFMLASYQSISIASGLQRAFTIPLLIVFLYYLVVENYAVAAVLIAVSALFYWPNFPLMVLTYGLALLRPHPRYVVTVDFKPAKIVPLVLTVVLSLLLLAWGIVMETALFTPQNVPVTQDARLQVGGATPLFISFPWFGRAGIFDAGTDVVNFLVLMILAGFTLKIAGRSAFRRVPRTGWILLVAAGIMYVASFVTLVGFSSSALYQPSRYTRSTLFLVVLLFVGLNWPDVLKKGPAWLAKKSGLIIFFFVALTLVLGISYLFFPDRLVLIPLIWFIGIIASGLLVVFGSSALFWLATRWPTGGLKFAALLAVGILTLAVGAYYIRTLGLRTSNPSPSERELFEFVGSLPKAAVLAGDPWVMSDIPLFSKRSVLFRELHPDANPNITAFVMDYYDAQYAEATPPVLDFCERYQVTHLVLNDDYFTPAYLTNGQFFYQPWNDDIVKRVHGRTDFALLNLKPIFTSGPYRVIQCDAETLLAASKK